MTKRPGAAGRPLAWPDADRVTAGANPGPARRRPARAAANGAVTYRSRWLRPAGSTFFTALSGEQEIEETGPTDLLGLASLLALRAFKSQTSEVANGLDEASPGRNEAAFA